MTPAPRNLITDVPGLKVGNAHCEKTKSGVTVLIPDEQAVASVAILGGAPGTRDIALLEPEQTVNAIDALVLSGGSAFGLDAGSGAQVRLAELGKGFKVGSAVIPITPTAILFDLLNGGINPGAENQSTVRWASKRSTTLVTILSSAQQAQALAPPPQTSKAASALPPSPCPAAAQLVPSSR